MRGWTLVLAIAAIASASEPRYRIELEPAPEPADWAAFHKWRIDIRAPYGFAPRIREFQFECRLALLNRVPSVAPRVTAVGPGRFIVENVRFDIPGEWEIEARIRVDDGWRSATRRIRAGQADLLDRLRSMQPNRASRFDRYVGALVEGNEPESGSRLTEAEQAGLRVYLGRLAGCQRCHDAPHARTILPKRHADHLSERDRADLEAFLETLAAPAPLE